LIPIPSTWTNQTSFKFFLEYYDLIYLQEVE